MMIKNITDDMIGKRVQVAIFREGIVLGRANLFVQEITVSLSNEYVVLLDSSASTNWHDKAGKLHSNWWVTREADLLETDEVEESIITSLGNLERRVQALEEFWKDHRRKIPKR